MLIENTMFGEQNKIDIAIDRIKFAYEVAQHRELGALYVCFSGGKDSTVLAELCRLAKERYGVEYELHYNITGIDPPELIQFMWENYRCIYRRFIYQDGDVIWIDWVHPKTANNKIDLYFDIYQKSMWQLIEEKHMPPTRLIRYCCAELKERGGENRMCLTGVRWAESVRRKQNRTAFEKFDNSKMLFNDNDEGRLGFENCTMKKKLVCNPIVDWEDSDVWDFIRLQKLPYCKLYDEGNTRLGCIGCPMQGGKGQLKDFERYPKFKNLYLMAFDQMLKDMTNEPQWQTAEDVFNWWVNDKADKPIEGQISFEELRGEK